MSSRDPERVNDGARPVWVVRFPGQGPVGSVHGPQPVASWRCEPCDSGSGEHMMERTGAVLLLTQAMEHVRVTGHTVQFRRGTCEDITVLDVEAPR